MDLPDQAARLSLDVAAIAVCATLRKAEVPHVVLKGPSTALWLYDPPRTYRDIDVLVPRMAIDRAVAALGEAGVATPTAGGVGEEAPHSLLMKTSSGHELDLHISLPTLPIASDNRLWKH